MPLAASVKIPMGTLMPSFQATDPGGKEYQSKNLPGTRGLLVIFTCDRSPCANAAWPRLVRHAGYAKNLGINTAAINPNVHDPKDGPKEMLKKIKELKIPFPYLADRSQDIAKKFQAQCTPDIFLYDHDQKLVYHGRIDDNWEDETKVTVPNLKLALDALAAGKLIEKRQISSMGCSIKWRSS